jgi:hypothetical protein
MKKLSNLFAVVAATNNRASPGKKIHTHTRKPEKPRVVSRCAVRIIYSLGGLQRVLGDGEWVMNNQQIPIKTYEKLPAFFNPD